MPLPRSFKTDESFLEKIAIGATGTRQTFANLQAHGHQPIELERGSMSYKIWKAIKIKRVRVPDILCLRCAHRVESRAKTNLEITMSHSQSDASRGWDAGLDNNDVVALVHCERTGEGPLDWRANPLVQYVRVESLREAFRQGLVKEERPKGAQEGFELRITWPASLVSEPGIVEEITESNIKYRKDAGGLSRKRLIRAQGRLTPLVTVGSRVAAQQFIAAVVPVTTSFPCPGGATAEQYIKLSMSTAISDRYTAVKAMRFYTDPAVQEALLQRVQDSREHIYVRVEAAAGLMRQGNAVGREFLSATLNDTYLENRLEAVIILGEVATPEAARLLISVLQDAAQNAEIRAGAAWALGEVGTRDALPVLVNSFTNLDTVIKIEAARALAKISRHHLGDVLQSLPTSTPEQRPGIAWALSKAGGFRIADLLPALVDDDARHWVSYVIGTQDKTAMLPEIETLAARDPQVYFAVTLLWKIIASWVYELEEY